MPHTIADRAGRWGMDANAKADYMSLFAQIEYLADKRFLEYHPTIGPPHMDFMFRLRDWLDSASREEDQQTLFRLVPNIFFIGIREFNALYRTAFNGPIARWLVNELGLQLDDPQIEGKLSEAIKSTWFCSITDSMQISAFYHVNNIEGVDLRPEWRTLHQLGDSQKIVDYMTANGLERIVLLEDFIGSGSQMLAATIFAAALPSTPPLLIVPLVICPPGFQVGQQLEAAYSHVNFSPSLVLPEDAFISEVPRADEDPLSPLVREMIVRLYTLVSGGLPPATGQKPYGPFGFGPPTPRRGALVVMYTNCPDNTLPIIHHGSDTWKPLFPRSSRL